MLETDFKERRTIKRMKKYQLTAEETKNILGREQAIGYMEDLIKRDINMYLYMEVIKRLGLPEDGKYNLSPDRTWVEVAEVKNVTK